MDRTSGRWAGLLGALALACLLAVPAMPSATARSLTALGGRPLAAELATRTSKALDGTGVFRLGTLYGSASGYERFEYVIVGRDDASSAARLPATSLVYMSGTSIQRSWSTGVSFDEALANGWLLRDSAGDLVKGLNGSLLADIGSREYQRRFADNVLAFLRKNRDDGIFLDDVIADPSIQTNGIYPAKYPTAAAWESAMVSFVATVGASLQAQEHEIVANAVKFISGDVRSDDGTFAREFGLRLAPHVSGLAFEYWLQNPLNGTLRATGIRWTDYWPGWQDLVSAVQRAGVDFFGIMYGTSSDVRAMRFGRGCFLLDWNGRGGALAFHMSDRSDPHHAAWVKQLGSPVGRKIERASGIWQRRYELGIVAVNATQSPVSIPINGAPTRIAPTDAVFIRMRRP